jgi:hypothetical protein
LPPNVVVVNVVVVIAVAIITSMTYAVTRLPDKVRGQPPRLRCHRYIINQLTKLLLFLTSK